MMKEKNSGIPINQEEIYTYLKDIRKIAGGEAKVLLLDSSGYDCDVTKLSIDHDAVIIS